MLSHDESDVSLSMKEAANFTLKGTEAMPGWLLAVSIYVDSSAGHGVKEDNNQSLGLSYQEGLATCKATGLSEEILQLQNWDTDTTGMAEYWSMLA